MNDPLTELLNSSNQLVTLVILIIAGVFIFSIVRSLVKVIMPIVIVGLVLVVFLGYTPEDVIDKGKQFASNSSSIIMDGILPFFNSEKGTGSTEKAPGFLEEELKEFLDKEEKSPVEFFEENKSDIEVNKL
ncbi:hypothetical protein [Litchfieldia salsa]|uniref:Uncharacterized protein n=1 Tax=Litchfieldia salsa TaxID=930152 RepID=A0A1H0URQ5_9BACI|nr:hypothetical protein [Litchfieldia salsa]SDP68949.1 hypothetical protein SAMN05216565_105126 [Litchfieldia salsa]